MLAFLPIPLAIVFSAVLGLLVGSFLNVVVLRWKTGMGIGGRSQCFSCGHQLCWVDLIPVFSYLALLGKCRYCKTKISSQYAWVELVTSLWFTIVMVAFGATLSTLYFWVLGSILIVLSVYDIRHRIIPDELSLAFGTLALLAVFLDPLRHFAWFGVQWWHLVAAVALPLPFVLIWLFSKGRMMGLGDPKLMVGIGLLLGPALGATAIMLSFWVGAGFAIIMMIYLHITRKANQYQQDSRMMKLQVPFGPFLAFGTMVVIILREPISLIVEHIFFG